MLNVLILFPFSYPGDGDVAKFFPNLGDFPQTPHRGGIEGGVVKKVYFMPDFMPQVSVHLRIICPIF